MDGIVTFERYWRKAASDHLLVAAANPSATGDATLPDGVDRRTVIAEVNHGRWIVRCPFCPGAELANTTSSLFFCCGCRNAQAGHRYLRVTLPVQRVAIEVELLKRPDGETRNWLPGESVADLRLQNAKQLGKAA